MKHLLIVGSSGSGKTTLIQRLMRSLSHLPIQGFVTEEFRQADVRAGFWLSLADGRQILLAHRQSSSGFARGPYRINMSVLDEVAAPLIASAHQSARALFIDELSKIEPASAAISNAVREALDRQIAVIATANIQPSVFISSLKRRRDVELVPLTITNRETVEEELKERLAFLCADDPLHQRVEHQANRICELIVSGNVPVLDIEIQQSRLQDSVAKLFPNQPQLYQLLYEMRFRRLWQQFRQEAAA